jgi:hypothetical protein
MLLESSRGLEVGDAQRAAKIADWARQETAAECLGLVKRAQFGVPSSAEAALTNVFGEISKATETRESMMASPNWADLREAYEGREPEAVRRYEQRPKENNNPFYEDQAVIPDWQCLGSL